MVGTITKRFGEIVIMSRYLDSDQERKDQF